MIEKWKTKNSKLIGKFRIFDLWEHTRQHPITQRDSAFYELTTTNWVNIIPLTNENEIILVEQYRHGIDNSTIEVPAGLIEEGEAPSLAAKRECQEETGYSSSDEVIFIGKVLTNPAFLNNYCYHYLWPNCEQKFSQALDENEHIQVIKVPFSDINNLIENEKINHSLVISALYHYNRYLQNNT